MIMAIIISSIGFIISSVLHLLMLFKIYIPPNEFMLIINIGAGFSVYAAIVISKKICDHANIRDFRKVMLSISPVFSGLTGLLIMYAFAGLMYFLFKRCIANSEFVNSENGTRTGFTGHWMALYALAFTIVYSCKKYLSKLKDEQ